MIVKLITWEYLYDLVGTYQFTGALPSLQKFTDIIVNIEE